ncbi:thiamine-phosphate kinase [Thiogranum longum]|uniref:Thiamine-monophosphate kinase n=1 Tax=Thiogranum longum TaxID=1537524 RepID=A0A4R1HB97_9GAMM|nr:thiamine-phosphate kinase [Thiogranum longum]TCK17440.1 thiamine-phosphate kinase [Thiogranum longum]
MVSEFEIIHRFFQRELAAPGVLLGIGDDAAILMPDAGSALVVAVDTLVAGRHFPDQTDPVSIGHKALAVNLSDLAAMGAQPRWATLALTLPKADEAWLSGFAEGFFALADRFHVALVGGDTTRGPLSMTVQVQGQVDAARALRRDAAKPGQHIFITGTPGDAAFALQQLQAGEAVEAALLARLNRPEPRIALGMTLAGVAEAAIDVSDGLLADIQHMLDASACGAQINVDAIPRSQALLSLDVESALTCQLNGGDDYELCFTVDADRVEQVYQAAEDSAVSIAEIGIIEPQPGIRCVHEDGSPCTLKVGGFDHFANNHD